MPGMHALIGSVLMLAGANDGLPVEEHPLIPVLRMARDGYQRMETDVRDYTCRLTKRERINGRLRSHESMYVKVRHRQVTDGRVDVPFSVYVRFDAPKRVRGREVLYVEGRNGGKAIVRNGGISFSYVTTAVVPDSDAVMRESRYPLTEIGMKTLTQKLIEVGEEELSSDTIEVEIANGAKIADRPCRLLQVLHSTYAKDQRYHFVRIFIDEQLQMPVYYAAYGWPEEGSDASPLLEEYVYTDIRLNVGLTDRDFDHRNERYSFLKSFQP